MKYYRSLQTLSSKPILIALLIFIFAVLVRSYNFAEMGQTWDETAYVLDGHKLIKLISKADFGNEYWYHFPDHPPLAKYLYGIVSYLDLNGTMPNGNPSFNFDFNFMRLLSLFYGALASILVYFFVRKYFSNTVGILSSVILALLPVYVGMNQLVTLESPIVLFFIATIFAFMSLLEKPSNKKIILVGILLGLTISIKITNLLIVPILFGSLLIYIKKHKMSRNQALKIMLIFPISIVMFFALWPALWFHPLQTFRNALAIRVPQLGSQSLFLGEYKSAPVHYFLIYFLVTTPLLVIFFFFIGLKDILRKPSWQYATIILWFFVPFLLSFYNLKQGGIRYIIEIYPALSILASLGIVYLARKFKENGLQLLYIFIPVYLLISLFLISPYYLNYFNSLVGGPGGVYSNKTFDLGWWGEGQREAVKYLLKVAQPGQTVGVYVVPKYLLPPVEGLEFKFYDKKEKYDYLIVNYYALLQKRQDYNSIPKDYGLVYSVQAGGAPIVNVYKRTN